MKVDPKVVEDVAKKLYIRALKVLPDDIKQGFQHLDAAETNATAKSVLGTMIENIKVAEATENLLCQDTGIPIYNVTLGRDMQVDGHALKQAIHLHGMALGWLAFGGVLDAGLVNRFLWCLPLLLLGSWLGLKLYHRINEQQFRRLILGLLLVSGAALVVY